MNSYEPNSRIREEVDPEVTTHALELCLRFLMSNTVDDFSRILTEINTILEQEPNPIDPLKFLYDTLASQSLDRILFLKVVEQWGEENNISSKAVGIEPSRWKVTLKAETEYSEVDVEQALDYHIYENPSFLIGAGEDRERQKTVNLTSVLDIYQNLLK